MPRSISAGGTVLGPYSPALLAGATLYISGQLPLDPGTGELSTAAIGEQTRIVMSSIGALLKEAGMDYRNLVKTTIFLADLGDFSEVNAAYQSFLEAPYPARATVQVAALPKGARIEIEAIAEN